MASDFWMIVGIGNPGKKYDGTRHNLGFMALDVLTQRWSVNLTDHKGLAMVGKAMMDLDSHQIKTFFVKPLTYVNSSGDAVASLCDYYDIDPSHVIVIHDDMDLDFGRVKVKSGGSSGGHNGIKSIDKSLGTKDYARVRLGMGHSARGDKAHEKAVNWVLGTFSPSQQKELSALIDTGADAAEMIASQGVHATQEEFNGRSRK